MSRQYHMHKSGQGLPVSSMIISSSTQLGCNGSPEHILCIQAGLKSMHAFKTLNTFDTLYGLLTPRIAHLNCFLTFRCDRFTNSVLLPLIFKDTLLDQC